MKKRNGQFNQFHTATKYMILILYMIFMACVTTGCAKKPEVEKPAMAQALQVASWERAESTGKLNSYAELCVPTCITKLGDLYFIVDCYHDQVIYHDNLTDDLTQWQVLTDDIDRGHTIVSDGVVYLVDDTENNRILVFEQEKGEFVQTQVLDRIGTRPHFLVYDERTETFYAWSSMTGEMYLIYRNDGDNRMYVSEVKQIPSLEGVYVRSFTIDGDDVYFVSGNSSIIRADLQTFLVKNEYPVPPELAGMIQLMNIEDMYYITISTDVTGNQEYATIIRTEQLENLEQGEYEDVYEYFIGGGTPYFMTSFDGLYYVTEHRLLGHGIWQFDIQDGEITDVQAIY